jgi:hypothetical protein
MASQINNSIQITGVSISHIIFDESDYVTLWCACRINGRLQSVNLSGSVRSVNDMLRYSGSKGEEIILGMADAMLNSGEPPYVVNLRQLIGHHAVLTSCRLSLLPAMDPEDKTRDTQCWWIDDVQVLNQLQQAKNLAQHIRDFGSADAIFVNTTPSKINLAELAAQYHYYLGLLELDINEDAARSKSGLHDQRLFEMAKML